ncbi:MAG: hypothetical protein KKB81_00040 [Candidatus Margulisbacteria bacterium]|nr:hypothetical protein [Candidatus Margulisiibacteriota bacterium]MBU1022344.1 hypothetical protein [Candidatus Margulisiibacteriota bacterium]MBU1954475.1 hypothetical protein [Candidatus Margulisiibacteriota bacterium]
MRVRIVGAGIVCLVLLSGMAGAETEIRTYRQFKDVAVKENGSVMKSDRKENLFECTYTIDMAKKTITRTKIRRLDDPSGIEDPVVYEIKQKTKLWGSEAGNGGEVLIAIREDGGEILEMGRRFAFTQRVSPFSMVITGVYRRVFSKGEGCRSSKDDKDAGHRPQRTGRN